MQFTQTKMTSYTAAGPADGTVKPEILKFYERFYEVSDSPSGHQDYADMFTKDGKIIIGTASATGTEGLSLPIHGHWHSHL